MYKRQGIENASEPPLRVEGDASARTDLAPLPRNLREATTLLDGSQRVRQLLGPAFVEHYVRTRDWEWRQYEKAVTEWELARYFETV